jgi:hypothetical protein
VGAPLRLTGAWLTADGEERAARCKGSTHFFRPRVGFAPRRAIRGARTGATFSLGASTRQRHGPIN